MTEVNSIDITPATAKIVHRGVKTQKSELPSAGTKAAEANTEKIVGNLVAAGKNTATSLADYGYWYGMAIATDAPGTLGIDLATFNGTYAPLTQDADFKTGKIFAVFAMQAAVDATGELPGGRSDFAKALRTAGVSEPTYNRAVAAYREMNGVESPHAARVKAGKERAALESAEKDTEPETGETGEQETGKSESKTPETRPMTTADAVQFLAAHMSELSADEWQVLTDLVTVHGKPHMPPEQPTRKTSTRKTTAAK